MSLFESWVSGYFNYHPVPGNLIRLSGFHLGQARSMRCSPNECLRRYVEMFFFEAFDPYVERLGKGFSIRRQVTTTMAVRAKRCCIFHPVATHLGEGANMMNFKEWRSIHA
jgi:hypothetical protein